MHFRKGYILRMQERTRRPGGHVPCLGVTNGLQPQQTEFSLQRDTAAAITKRGGPDWSCDECRALVSCSERA